MSFLSILLVACIAFFSISSFSADNRPLCEDFYKAACLDKSGQKIHDGKRDKEALKSGSEVDKIRNQTAELMGHKDFADGYIKALKKEGIGLEIEDMEEFKEIHSLGSEGSLSSIDPRDFSDSKACRAASKVVDDLEAILKEVDEIDKSRDLEFVMGDITAIKQKIKKFHADGRVKELVVFNKRQREIAKYDLSEFYELARASCESEPEEEKANKKNKVLCKNFQSFRAEFLDTFRQLPDSKQNYEEMATSFISKHWDSVSSEIYSLEGTPKDFQKELRLIQQFKNSALGPQNQCSNVEDILRSKSSEIYEEYALKVNRSKPTIDSLINAFQNDSQKKRTRDAFEKSRETLLKIVPKLTKDPLKLDKLTAQISSVDFQWIEKPSGSEYKVDADTGLKVLKTDFIHPYSYAYGDSSGINHVVSEAELYYFTSGPNAFYKPFEVHGNKATREHIGFTPTLVRGTEGNDIALMEIAAHEFGHFIGPYVSNLNGYNLTDELSSLLSCYSSSESIGMRRHQKDETIADYISSEVIAAHLTTLPESERISELKKSVAYFCSGDDEFHGNDTHADSVLRVAGIVGASSNIRKILKCDSLVPPPKYKYKSCGLNISLDEIAPNKTKKLLIPSDPARSVQ